MIRKYLSDIINDHKDEWKIQLSMRINFVSSVDSEDSNKTHVMYTNSDNIVIIIGYETDEIIEKFFKSHLERCQQGLEEIMSERSDYVFDSFELLHYRLHKISLNRGGSYIDSPKWLKNKRATINPKNKDDKCVQYAITVALNYQKINNHLEKICNITPFINKYDCNEIEFPSQKKAWNKFEKNSKTIALNVLFVPYNNKQIRTAYLSKHNSDREKQVIVLMITGVKNGITFL